MSEQGWILALMLVGAAFEILGVSVIGIELRTTRLATERFAKELKETEDSLLADHQARRPREVWSRENLWGRKREPLPMSAPDVGKVLDPIVEFMVDVTAGSRRLRMRGFLALLAGILVTLIANGWALFRA